MPSVLDILRPQVVNGIMNEIKTPFDRWQDFFGLGPKGSACDPSETRSVSYDVLNDDRKVSAFSAPGSDATRIAPQVIGNRVVTCPRAFEAIELSYEVLNNIRAVGKAADPGSQAALSYVRVQADMLKRRMRRWREFLIWGALRGACSFVMSGTKWIPVMTGGTISFDWQVSANHKNQANGIVGTSWDNAAAPLIGDLADIDAQSEADCGIPIRHIWCNGSRMQKILQNTEVRNLGGSANTAFEQWLIQMAQMKAYGGTDVDAWKIEASVVLKGYPSITFHVTNRIIDLNGTSTKFLGDDELLLHPDPDREWMKGYEVKESTNQTTGQAPVDVYGNSSWIKQPVDSDTPKYLLYGLDNFFPAVNPNAVWFLDVTP